MCVDPSRSASQNVGCVTQWELCGKEFGARDFCGSKESDSAALNQILRQKSVFMICGICD
jgi:hypothetical protein